MYNSLYRGSFVDLNDGYTISCNKWNEFDKKIYYARIIRKLQRELGLEVSDFECLN
jgi:hypothetical protein